MFTDHVNTQCETQPGKQMEAAIFKASSKNLFKPK